MTGEDGLGPHLRWADNIAVRRAHGEYIGVHETAIVELADVLRRSEAEVAALRERVSALEGALKPFAAAWGKQVPHLIDVFDILTPADFRRAAATLPSPDSAGRGGE